MDVIIWMSLLIQKILKFYLAAQIILRPNPPSKINHPIAFPIRINNPPIRIPAAGPVPALKLGYIR
jgi:hypothetical protein